MANILAIVMGGALVAKHVPSICYLFHSNSRLTNCTLLKDGVLQF